MCTYMYINYTYIFIKLFVLALFHFQHIIAKNLKSLNTNPSSLSRGKVVYHLLYLKIHGVFWLQACVNEGYQTVPSGWILFLSTFLYVGSILNKLLSMCSKDDLRILRSACATSEKNNLSPLYAFCSFKRLCLTLLGHLFTLGTKEVLQLPSLEGRYQPQWREKLLAQYRSMATTGKNMAKVKITFTLCGTVISDISSFHSTTRPPGDGEGQEAWRAAVHGVSKSRTRPSNWTIKTTIRSQFSKENIILKHSDIPCLLKQN